MARVTGLPSDSGGRSCVCPFVGSTANYRLAQRVDLRSSSTKGKGRNCGIGFGSLLEKALLPKSPEEKNGRSGEIRTHLTLLVELLKTLVALATIDCFDNYAVMLNVKQSRRKPNIRLIIAISA